MSARRLSVLVVDDSTDAADSTAVLSELPPAGRLVYRYVIRPRYTARHRRTHRMPL